MAESRRTPVRGATSKMVPTSNNAYERTTSGELAKAGRAATPGAGGLSSPFPPPPPPHPESCLPGRPNCNVPTPAHPCRHAAVLPAAQRRALPPPPQPPPPSTYLFGPPAMQAADLGEPKHAALLLLSSSSDAPTHAHLSAAERPRRARNAEAEATTAAGTCQAAPSPHAAKRRGAHRSRRSG